MCFVECTLATTDISITVDYVQATLTTLVRVFDVVLYLVVSIYLVDTLQTPLRAQGVFLIYG